jgi:hypothetical protein
MGAVRIHTGLITLGATVVFGDQGCRIVMPGWFFGWRLRRAIGVVS